MENLRKNIGKFIKNIKTERKINKKIPILELNFYIYCCILDCLD